MDPERRHEGGRLQRATPWQGGEGHGSAGGAAFFGEGGSDRHADLIEWPVDVDRSSE